MANSTANGPPQLTWANITASILVLSVLAAGAWAITQIQYGHHDKDIKRIEDDITRIDAELLLRRTQFPTQAEFQQYEKRMDNVISETQARLRSLEQTRPTTGELQGIAKSSDTQINRILDRLDRLDIRVGK